MKRILAFLLSALLLLSCIGCAKTAGGGDALSDALNNAMQGRPAQSPTPAPKPAPTEAPPVTPAANGAEALARLCAGIWVCELEYDENDDDALPINGYLFFDESGSVRYEIGYDTSANGEHVEIWKGVYDLAWDAGQNPPAGTIAFSMELTESLFEFSEDVPIKRAGIGASYRLETEGADGFTLYLEDGDPLYILKDSRPLNGGDDDPRVYHFEFCTGYTGGPGYADVENASNTVLAYVKLDKTLKDGSARLLIDEVRWVDDEEERNDYRIENDAEEWIPYTAYEWTQCYMWFYVSVALADLRFQVSFDEFLSELEWRSDGILANVTIVEGDILIISEVYTP